MYALLSFKTSARLVFGTQGKEVPAKIIFKSFNSRVWRFLLLIAVTAFFFFPFECNFCFVRMKINVVDASQKSCKEGIGV